MWKYSCSNSGCPFVSNNIISLRNHNRSCPFIGTIISPDDISPDDTAEQQSSNCFQNQLGKSTCDHRQETEKDPSFEQDISQEHFIDQCQGSTEIENTEIPSNINDYCQPYISSQHSHATGLDEHGPCSDFLYHSTSKREERCKSLAIVLLKICRKAGAASVNDLIKNLIDEDLQIEDVRRNITNVKQCENIVHSLINRTFSSDGFEEHVISDDSGNKCVLYKRSIKDVLEDQINHVTREKFFISPNESRTALGELSDDIEIFSHPMSSSLGVNGCSIIYNEVNRCEDESVIWFPKNSSAPSVPLLIQMYSDKSQTSLKASHFQFYPVHAVSLNFEENERRNCIIQGRTIVGYLPVSFSKTNVENEIHNDLGRFQVSPGLGREQRIGLLHRCFQSITNEISKHFLKGFKVSTKDKISLHMHPALGCYVADLPETKDILSVMHGNRSVRNCHRCLSRSSDFGKFQENNPRTLSQTYRVLQKYKALYARAEFNNRRPPNNSKSVREAADKLLTNFSIRSQEPAIHSIPCAGTLCFDPYQVFSFEPLHVLHLGVTKMILSCIHLKVKYISSRPTVLFNKMNSFLREVHHIYKCQDLHVDLGSSGKTPALNGLFSFDGLIGMLEAKDYKRIEKVMPFLGSICDRSLHCGENAPVTRVCTQFASIIRQLYRKGKPKYWKKDEIMNFKSDLSQFKTLAVSVLGSYQKSTMGTMKFHLLDHLTDDLYRMGYISVCCAGIFEYTHVHFKASYKSTSRRDNEALKSTVKRREEDLALQNLEYENVGKKKATNIPINPSLKNNKVLCKSKSGILAMESDIATTAHSSVEISLDSLDSFLATTEDNLHNSREFNILEHLSENIEPEGLTILLTEIHSVLSAENLHHQKNVTLGFHSSAQIPSIETPDSSSLITKKDTSAHVHVENKKDRFLYKLVCARDYHNAHGLRQDSVMLRNDSCECGDSICVWFASLRSILSLKVRSNTGDIIFERQFVFVNFFEVVPDRDNVDVVLNCIRLRWERAHTDLENDPQSPKPCKRKTLDPGKWFGLTPIESILGVLPIVPTDGFDPYDKSSSERVNISSFHSQLPWFDQYFHINRFYSADEEKMYSLK